MALTETKERMSRDLWQKFTQQRVIVMSAPNGARRTKQDHPALPISPQELARDARRLCDAGVSVLHLHVRDERGCHTLDAGSYRDAIDAIRASVGEQLIIQITTEAVGRYNAAEQRALVREIQPEAVSLALRELCASKADEARFADLCNFMAVNEIWPQFILYSPDDVRHFERLRALGTLSGAMPFALFVLGNYAQRRDGAVADLHALLAETKAYYPWSVCCFGPNEHAVARAAAELGGHVRLGFENNLVLANGRVAADNAALVQQFTAELDSLPRSTATAAELRALLAQSSD